MELPGVGLGTYPTGGYECFEAVKRALDAGYRHVDTAMTYENEATVGRAVATSSVDRDEVFITTKIKGCSEFLEYDGLLEAADGCLQRLGTDYVDLLLLHWWIPGADMEEAFAATDRLVESGKVRQVGVSNFSVDQLRKAMNVSKAPIATNQVEYHPYWEQDELLEFCRANDIVLTAYSPLAEGEVVDDEVLRRIGNRYGKSPAQVAIRWLIQQEGVVTIPKAVTPTHIYENIDVFDFELSKREMVKIDELEGPFWFRQKREGGLVHRSWEIVGPLIPKPILERIR